jgi:hypothetical protein
MRVYYVLGMAATMSLGGGCLQVLVFQEATLDQSCCTVGGGGSGATGTTASTTSSSAGGGGGGTCGDGKAQAPEECDNGAENGPQKACKADCTLNVCGDGDVGPGEKCDEGAANGLGLLKCAPDCSRTIVKKQIVVSQEQMGSNFEPNPVAHADAACPPNYKALFVFGDARRATTSANEITNPVDWVLAPYTYYYNAHSNPVWLTDAVALLGVRNGAFVGLENPVREIITAYAVTGLAADWTTLGKQNCSGWSKLGGGVDKSVGFTFGVDITFLVDSDLTDCSSAASFYCVEQ